MTDIHVDIHSTRLFVQVFPADCMQSAVIEVPVPSTHTLTYLVTKPLNETNELVLSNTGRRCFCALFLIDFVSARG